MKNLSAKDTQRVEIVVAAFVITAFIYGVPALYHITGGNQSATALKPSTLISLSNEDRVREGVQPLVTKPALMNAAQAKANDMAKLKYYAHENPDGNDVRYWVGQTGYQYSAVGENLYLTYRDEQYVNRAWLKSPSHRANMLLPLYTETGVGVAQGWYKGFPATFIVQIYAKPIVSAKIPITKTSPKSTKTTVATTTVTTLASSPVATIPSKSSEYLAAQIAQLTKQLEELRNRFGSK